MHKCIFTIIGCVTLLSSCALTPEQSLSMSDYDLCSVAHAPMAPRSRANSAWAELNRRGANCEKYSSALASRQQANTGMMFLGAGMMAAPPSSIRTTTCTYRAFAGSVTQVCQ